MQGASKGSSAFITRKLGAVGFQLYASPEYLARRGAPRSVAELAEHDVVAIGASKSMLPGTPRIVTAAQHFARAVLRGGAGIGLLPTYLATEDVKEGRLVRALPSFQAHTGTIHLVLPSKKHLSSKVTAFRDLLVEMF